MSDTSAFRIALASDKTRCYYGDPLTLYVALWAPQGAQGATLSVRMPHGLRVESFHAPGGLAVAPAATQMFLSEHALAWDLPAGLPAGECIEFTIACVAQRPAEGLPLPEHDTLDIFAEVGPSGARVEEALRLHVDGRAHYLKHLPSLFRDDELMGGLLMLFESFWKPIEQQIDHIDVNFDPYMAPARLLPWLAGWADLVLDERLPEARRRRLLARMIALYRMRGTNAGVREFIEIYTGLKPDIIEHRGQPFVIGAGASLGAGISLGRLSAPHTFTVNVRVPANGDGLLDTSLPAEERRERLRKMVASILDSEKPAHARYTLNMEFA